jgi:hypothetical protein
VRFSAPRRVIMLKPAANWSRRRSCAPWRRGYAS